MASKLAWLPAAAGALALGVLLTGALDATSAGADPRFVRVLSYDSDPLHPIQERRRGEPIAADDLVAGLAARGYRDISTPRRKGGYYVVEAIGQRGERLTLIVDAVTGEVSGLRRRFD